MANAPSKADNEPLGVQNARARYEASGVSSPRVPPGHKLTEVGMIPEEWVAQALGPHVQINSGESPSLFRFETSGVPYFKVDQLNNDSKYLSATPYFFRKGKTVPRGSVIFPKRGASILLNKVRILASDSFMDTNLMTLTPEVSLDNEYLYYTLTHIGLWKFADTTSIPQINNKHLNPLVVPIPPLPEQRAIAATLSDVDALLARLDALIAKKRDLKQAAMQLLLTGQTRLPGFSGEWKVKRLFDLAEQRKELFDDGDWIEAEFLTESGVRLVQTGNIGEGLFLEKESRKYISADSFKKLGCKELRVGDILICRLAEPAGRACILPDIGEERVITAVDVTIFRPLPTIAGRRYLVHVFNTWDWFSAVSERCGGSTRTRIARGELGKIEITLPPLPEQTAIATVLSNMDAEIAALEARRDKTRALKQGMMQELLTGRIRLV